MGEQTEGRAADHGQRFTDRGQRFTDRGQRFTDRGQLGRRRFLWKAGSAALAVGAGAMLAGCQFDDGAYQGKDTGQSSTSGQNPTSSPTSGQGGSGGSQSGMSS
jgi:hypothetical protein